MTHQEFLDYFKELDEKAERGDNPTEDDWKPIFDHIESGCPDCEANVPKLSPEKEAVAFERTWKGVQRKLAILAAVELGVLDPRVKEILGLE